MRLENFAFLEANPTHRKPLRRRHEVSQLIVPLEVPQLAELVHLSALFDLADWCDRVSGYDLNLFHHSAPYEAVCVPYCTSPFMPV
jgi:hypothetical protein